MPTWETRTTNFLPEGLFLSDSSAWEMERLLRGWAFPTKITHIHVTCTATVLGHECPCFGSCVIVLTAFPEMPLGKSNCYHVCAGNLVIYSVFIKLGNP